MTARLLALAVGAGATIFLGACGNSTPSHHTTTTTTSRAPATSSTTSTSTTSSIVTTTTSASTTTTTVAVPTACNRISASAGQMMGAAGTITGLITLTNSGPTTCVMNGYPVMALYSGTGAALVVTMMDGLTVNLSPAANGPPTAVSIPPAGTAQFNYQYSDVPVGSETSCPTSEMAEVTPPGGRAASPNFAFTADPCGNGTIRVSPVYG